MTNIFLIQTDAGILKQLDKDLTTQWLLLCPLMTPYYHFCVLKIGFALQTSR